MTAAYSYLRMSTLEQLKGDSRRRQLEAAQNYAAANGLVLLESFEAIGESAFDGENLRKGGSLDDFVKSVAAGKVARGSVFIVENLDRISRQQVTVALSLFLSLLDAGIEIVTLSDGQRYSQASMDKHMSLPLFQAVFSMSRAHEESALKSHRVGAAWAKKRDHAAAGTPMTAMAPAWLKLSSDRRSWLVDKLRELILKDIFRMTAEGVGSMSIARQLNIAGEPPWGPSRNGAEGAKRGWHPSAIKKILGNHAVLGVYQPHIMENGKRVASGPAIPNYFPRVITESEFWEARAATLSRLKGASGQKGPKFANLLSGLCFCSVCGGPVHFIDKGQPPKGGKYLRCDSARRRAGCESIESYRYDDIELAVLGMLSTRSFASIFEAEKDAAEGWRKEAAAVHARIETLNTRHDKLLDLFEVDLGADDRLRDRIRSVRAELDALVKEHARLSERMKIASEAPAVADESFGKSFEAAKAQLDAIKGIATAEAAYRARASLAQSLKRVVQRVVFYTGVVTLDYVDGKEATAILGDHLRVAPDGEVYRRMERLRKGEGGHAVILKTQLESMAKGKRAKGRPTAGK